VSSDPSSYLSRALRTALQLELDKFYSSEPEYQ
jgi:hypothetical protein